MPIDWSMHVPLYENPDGTIWYRFFKSRMFQKQDLFRRMVGHDHLDLFFHGPIFVKYDPSKEVALERYHSRDVTATWESFHAVQPIIIESKGELNILPVIPGSDDFMEGADLHRKEARNILPFIHWGFGDMKHHSGQRIFTQTPKGKPGEGRPLVDLDLTAYILLGLPSPLLLPEPDFIQMFCKHGL